MLMSDDEKTFVYCVNICLLCTTIMRGLEDDYLLKNAITKKQIQIFSTSLMLYAKTDSQRQL